MGITIFFFQPLDQFDLYLVNFLDSKSIFVVFFNWLPFFYFFFFFTLANLLLYSFFMLSILWLFCYQIVCKKLKLFPLTIWHIACEAVFYKFICSLLVQQTGERGYRYIRLVATLFFFILLSNFIGLIPYSFTATSHIFVTFLFSSSAILGLTVVGFIKQHLHFLMLFVPRGIPLFLLPLLVAIEFVSYVARGFSLGIRLFANLMSGHSLLHILLVFIARTILFNFILGFSGLSIILAIFLLEIGIAFLQAYVFSVLTAIYMRDAFDVGH